MAAHPPLVNSGAKNFQQMLETRIVPERAADPHFHLRHPNHVCNRSLEALDGCDKWERRLWNGEDQPGG
jgi:hypothetical protein